MMKKLFALALAGLAASAAPAGAFMTDPALMDPNHPIHSVLEDATEEEIQAGIYIALPVCLSEVLKRSNMTAKQYQSYLLMSTDKDGKWLSSMSNNPNAQTIADWYANSSWCQMMQNQ